jgi:hypothetical protein
MVMEKRGQTTIFIILGVVLVILVAIFLVGRQTELIPELFPAGDAQSEMGEIDEHVTDCLNEIGTQYITQIALQGGYLSVGADTYRMWNDTTVSYLCWSLDNGLCSNRLLTERYMEDQLENVLGEALSTCINVYDYSDEVSAAGDWALEVDVTQSAVVLDLDYPVEITKEDGTTAAVDGFSESVDVPLGELYDVAMDVVNMEAAYGDFDTLLYMLGKSGRYTIYKMKPYPDVLYQVKMRNEDFYFQFAIQGQESA